MDGQTGWITFDGRAVAPWVPGGFEGCAEPDEGTGPGGWKASEYWEEMKDMLNDALGG